MAADEPLEVENWVRERVLGSGGFGQVTLWRHKTNNEMIGEVQLHYVRCSLGPITHGLTYSWQRLICKCTFCQVSVHK